MNKEFYYVYCKGILGVKTNVSNFKWLYGSVAPESSKSEYEECIVKFDITVMPEKKLNEVKTYDKKFQAYTWNDENKSISCRRKILRHFKIGYDIQIKDNKVEAVIGKNYYRYVKNRTMNLHGMYYLLADIANVILLKNGFITLYASAVHSKKLQKSIIHFAPPNTGKTFIATKLCDTLDYCLVGEDIVITDGKSIYACPWTCSYRKNGVSVDDAGALGRISLAQETNIKQKCELTDIVVLSIGQKNIIQDKDQILKHICILNGYLFNYYSSPIVKMLAYFDSTYDHSWNKLAKEFIERIVKNTNCKCVQCEETVKFLDYV